MDPDGRTEWTDGRTDDAKTISLRLRRGIKMVLHSERMILLSMLYKAYLNVYYFYFSIKLLLLCLGKTTTACLVSAALLRVVCLFCLI